MTFLRSLGLIQRFAILIGALIFVTGLSARAFYTRQGRTNLEMRLREKAVFLQKVYSNQIGTSLIQKDDVTLLQDVNHLEEDKEITSVVVVDSKSQIRYHSDTQKVGTVSDEEWVKNVMQTGEASMQPFYNSGGKALAIVAPLQIQGMPHPFGAVRIDLTYLDIEKQLETSRQRYWFMILGSVVSFTGIALMFLSRWILIPFNNLRTSLSGINPSNPEPNLPTASGDLGDLYTALNDLILRFKGELQQRWGQQDRQQDQEKVLALYLAHACLPNQRILIADQDNRVISDSDNALETAVQPHLLDLIKDVNFANLLNAAFQKEGELVTAPVTFLDKNYTASVLSIRESTTVKTLIALKS